MDRVAVAGDGGEELDVRSVTARLLRAKAPIAVLSMPEACDWFLPRNLPPFVAIPAKREAAGEGARRTVVAFTGDVPVSHDLGSPTCSN